MGCSNYRVLVWLVIPLLAFACSRQIHEETAPLSGEALDRVLAGGDGAPGGPSAAFEEWGYRIVAGPGMGDLAVLQHDEVVWSINAYIVSYEPPRWKEPGLIELLVDARNTRRTGTEYRLELGPDGVKAVQESVGAPSGIQLPERPVPSFDLDGQE